jgi:chromosome segregation ATPase
MKNTNGTRVISSYTKSLPVKLTRDELLQKSAELAGTVQDYATEERRQADVKAQLKARLTELDARRTQLAFTVARQEEERDVLCEVVADLHKLVANITRADTGEIVSIRPLTDGERQDALPL